jgi:D-alanine-D-alanine ligase
MPVTGRKLRVGVIFGGRSREHAISIRSAHFVVESLDQEEFDLTLIGIDRTGRWHLLGTEIFAGIGNEVSAGGAGIIPSPRPGICRLVDLDDPTGPGRTLDVVFPVLHGPYGEDGTIQGLLDMIDVPYVGAGVLASAVGMDKDVQKRLLRDAGLPIVPFEVVHDRQWRRDAERVRRAAAGLGTLLFVKPANLGSSVGITKVAKTAELDSAIEHAFRYDGKILIERGVDAREIECAVIGNEEPEASIPGEIEPGAEFYSYEAKYDDRSRARLLIPAPLSREETQKVRELALRAFRALECSGMARVDFLLDRTTGKLYVNELNTIPGFTSISMYPKLWEASGLGARELVARLLRHALEHHRARSRRYRADPSAQG